MSDWARRSERDVEDSSHRTPTRRDRDRILYSDAFRRLAGVTQVAQGKPSMALHNRLTHSLKVEQVGASIYSKLRAENADLGDIADEDAIDAACLAHDLGHPPFGHAGEQELDALVVCDKHRENPRAVGRRLEDPCNACKLEDGFEGNAQSFRILSVLAVHRDSETEPLGLDLTRATLRAVSKYPWPRGTPGRKMKKWGAYDCDLSILQWVTGGEESDTNLDAEVMDWADDISYAVHDIEDFYRIGSIPIDDYKPNTDTLTTFLKYVESPGALGPLDDGIKEALDNLLQFFPNARFTGRTEDMAVLDRLRGTLLTQFIEAGTVVDGHLRREPTQESLNAVLKQFIWYHIIDGPTLTNIQAGQRRVLREIFEAYEQVVHDTYRTGQGDEPTEQELRRLPYGLRRAISLGLKQNSSYTRKQRLYRGIIDFLSGLSDAEAYEIHAVLKGREAWGHL